jgi:hypothetical protein
VSCRNLSSDVILQMSTRKICGGRKRSCHVYNLQGRHQGLGHHRPYDVVYLVASTGICIRMVKEFHSPAHFDHCVRANHSSKQKDLLETRSTQKLKNEVKYFEPSQLYARSRAGARVLRLRCVKNTAERRMKSRAPSDRSLTQI